MYYSSVQDAALLDDLVDTIKGEGEKIVEGAKREGERIVQEAVATVSPSASPAVRPVPRISILAGPRLTPLRASIPAVSDTMQPMRPAPFVSPSTMVAAPRFGTPGLEVAPAYTPPADLRFSGTPPQPAPSGGPSATTMLVIGAAALGVFLLLRK